MKIVLDDISSIFVDIVIANLNIVISKIYSHKLTNDDYDMIIAHLEFYKDLLKEAKHGKDN